MKIFGSRKKNTNFLVSIAVIVCIVYVIVCIVQHIVDIVDNIV